MAKDKVRVDLIALADYAMTSEDKKLSIIGIFDKIFVRTLPTTHARMAFVVTFVGEPNSEETLALRILGPSGNEEFNADVKISFGTNGRFNFVSNFEGFPVKEVGTYRFVFEQNKKEVASYPLEVLQVKEDGSRVAN